MKEKLAKEITDEIFNKVFDCDNNLNYEEILEKFAFDIKLPQEVKDSTNGEVTWATSNNHAKYISLDSTNKVEDWMQPKPNNIDLNGILSAWQKINHATTERNYGSENTFECDAVYQSENVIRSLSCFQCKNTLFSDNCHKSEYILACQRSGECNYCIRVDDSANCSNSYNVVCSAKISNSLFIQDCNTLYECMFCAHIENKRFCIANMQYEEEEYYAIKKEIIKWIMAQK